MRNTILIVDDSEDTRELFRATLEFEGFKVLDASNGESALVKLAENRDISLILLDISMPGLSGLQLLEEMKRRDLGQGIPVMLVSAVEGLQQMKTPPGVIDTLKKPFFYPELLYKIRVVHGLLPDRKYVIADKDRSLLP